MIEPFLIRAALAGLALALAAGPVGSFVIWRRIAFFGDATAHAAVLGVALALILSAPIGLMTFAIALLAGLILAALMARGHSGDASLGVLAHSALALGLVLISFVPGRVNLEAFLFGDILTTNWTEVAQVWLGALAVLALVAWRWRALLTTTLSPELAIASGLDPRREQLVLTLATAVLVAIGLKTVGALLVAAMLIIPAATARTLSRTPLGMVAMACGLAALSVFSGLGFSMATDAPAGPAIISAATIFYAFSLALPRRA